MLMIVAFLQLLSTSFLLPASALMNLSPIERFFLEPRLNAIKASVRRRYYETLSQLLVQLPSSCMNTGSLITSLPEKTISSFIFPGAGGIDALIEALQETLGETSVIVDWQEHRGTILTSAYDGEAVGQAIAELFLEKGQTLGEEVHLIGVSVGGFPANAAATLLYQQQKEMKHTGTGASACQIRLTLLDPFCGRGIFQPTYGKEHFGKYASVAIHILNTDDPVPTTNEPLPYCYCLDITEAKERDEFVPPPGESMHSWPLAYFIWKNGKVGNGSDDFPRGVVIKVDEWTKEALPPLSSETDS
jgi:hypothetical protein